MAWVSWTLGARVETVLLTEAGTGVGTGTVAGTGAAGVGGTVAVAAGAGALPVAVLLAFRWAFLRFWTAFFQLETWNSIFQV